jgi:hypothetical protein
MKLVLAMGLALLVWAAFYIAKHPVNPMAHSVAPVATPVQVGSSCPYHPELPFDRDVEQQKRNPGFGTTSELIAGIERMRTTNPNDMFLYTNNQRALTFIVNWQNNIQQPKSVTEALYLKSELDWWYSRLPYQFRDVEAEAKYVTLEAFINHWIAVHYC